MGQILAERAQVTRNFGQFIAHIKTAGDPVEPCVIFEPAFRSGPRPKFGIALSMLDQYFDEHSLPTPYARQKLEEAAQMMGFDDRHAVMKLMDALYEMVDELVKALPPEMEEPPDDRKRLVIGDVTLTRDGKIIGQDLVRL